MIPETRLELFMHWLQGQMDILTEADMDTLYHQDEVEKYLIDIMLKGNEILHSEGYSDGVQDSKNALVLANELEFPDAKILRCPECDSLMVVVEDNGR